MGHGLTPTPTPAGKAPPGQRHFARPEEVFAVVADPQGQVTIDSSGMLMSAAPGTITKVGDEFTIHMDREALNDIPALGLYDVTNVIIAFEADREIAWAVTGGG